MHEIPDDEEMAPRSYPPSFRSQIRPGHIITFISVCVTLLTIFSGILVFTFSTGVNYNQINSTLQRETDNRIAAQQAEIQARLAAEQQIRTESSSAISQLGQKVDGQAALNSVNQKNVEFALQELRTAINKLTEASTPQSRTR